MAEMRGTVNDAEELLQVVESQGVCQKIVEECRLQNAAAAKNKVKGTEADVRTES